MAYYVTVRDRQRVGFLVGPFNTHGAALAQVEPAREAAKEVNSDAHWFAFGTAHDKISRARVGRLNDRVNYQGTERLP